MRVILSISIFLSIVCGTLINAQVQKPGATTADQMFLSYTDKMGLCLSNFGIFGSTYNFTSKSPHYSSCEYPFGSGIEHLYAGALWIGAYKKTSPNSTNLLGPFVSTGSALNNTVYYSREFSSGANSVVRLLSTLPGSPYFNIEAVSHQDYITSFSDTSLSINGEPIPDHNPLNVVVTQTSHNWNLPFSDNIIFLQYSIKNISNYYLDSIYTGLWCDATIRQITPASSFSSAFFSNGGEGFTDSLGLGYEFDASPDTNNVNSYLGTVFLGALKGNIPITNSVNFTAWYHSNTFDPYFFSPATDFQRYQKLMGFFNDNARYNTGSIAVTLKNRSNCSYLLSNGSFSNLAPGDSIIVSYALICAKKYGIQSATLDTKEQKQNLFAATAIAKKIYHGNDANQNGSIEPPEDIFMDGKIHHFTLHLQALNPQELALVAGQPYTIKWYSEHIGDIRIDFSSDNGVNWSPIALNYPAAPQKYVWTVPNTLSDLCKFRFTSVANPSFQSETTTPFSITLNNSAPIVIWTTETVFPDTTYPAFALGWSAADSNGNESITEIRLALNDTTNYISLPPEITRITLRANNFTAQQCAMDILINGRQNTPASVLLPGLRLNAKNQLFIQAVDNLGGQSAWLSVKKSNNTSDWYVKKPKAGLLLIDNHAGYDNPTQFYGKMLDSLRPDIQYDYFNIAQQKLPYMNNSFLETIKLFHKVIWYSDYNPAISLGEAVIKDYIKSGGKVFLAWQLPQSFTVESVQNFLPILSTTLTDFLDFGVHIVDSSSSGYPVLKTSESIGIPRGFKLYPYMATPIYFPAIPTFNGCVSFLASNGSLFYQGLPLQYLNGFSGSVKQLLAKVLLQDFNKRQITLISPVGSEIIKAGNEISISWLANITSTVRIEFSSDNGTSWSIIATNYSVQNGSLRWATPNISSNNCFIRLIDEADPGNISVNIQPFTINATGSANELSINNPIGFSLLQNYPNPFNPVTTINFTLPYTDKVQLTIYNQLGEIVTVLLNSEMSSGSHSCRWNATAFPSGVYFYVLQSNSFRQAKKLILIK